MARKKRSEILTEELAIRPRPVVVAEREVQYAISAICPCCGRSIPKDRAIKAGYVTVDHIGYFASIDWDENKAFGVARETTGRGSFTNWHYISPEEAPELFEAVKARFLDAIREWVSKGWITEEDIRGIIET